jgi:hypothetical protein
MGEVILDFLGNYGVARGNIIKQARDILLIREIYLLLLRVVNVLNPHKEVVLLLD